MALVDCTIRVDPSQVVVSTSTAPTVTVSPVTAEIVVEGLAGIRGPKGEAGASGDVGQAGPQGPQGEAGPQGIQGIQGEPGAVGPAGPQGPQGEAGPQGDTGATGPMPDLASPGPIGGTTPDAGTFNQLNLKATSSAATLGLEMVINGSFTGNANGWNLGQNWAYGASNVVLTLDGATEGLLSQTIPGIVSGELYLVSWTQTHSVANNGTIRASIDTVNALASKALGSNTSGTISEIIKAAASGNLPVTLTPSQSSNGTGTITIANVSVKKITPSNGVLVVTDEAAASRLVARISSGKTGVYLGKDSGKVVTTGFDNVAVGDLALMSNTTGQRNTAIGVGVLQNNVTGQFNAGFGIFALSRCDGSQNSAYGNQSLYSCTTGGFNVASGSLSLFGCTTGNQNSGFGYRAGRSDISANSLTTASYCTFIGAESGFGSTVQYDNATAIGYRAKVTSANTVVLGRTTDTTVIGATAKDSSNALLQVVGSVKFTGQYINASTKTLTESSATGIVDIDVPAGSIASGELTYTIEANNVTDFQCLRGRVIWAVVNKGGILTTSLSEIVDGNPCSAGTLTAVASLTNGTNNITINLNAASSLAQTTLRARWRITHDGGTITAL
jgi:hypothetical protein